MLKNNWIKWLTTLAISAGAPLAASAEEGAIAAPTAPPVVVEFFMSQSCSSCASAVDFFTELAARDDIIALCWHVDYWNMLDTKHGRWADPYSSAAHTDRQRQYNKNIRKRSSVYTPQMIVAGVGEAPGLSRTKVNTLIDAAAAEQTFATINASAGDNEGEIVFDISESENGGNAFLITLKPETETNITHGENAGRTFKDVNVVTDFHRLGVIRRSGGEITAPAPADGENCALIVQEPKQGRIIAAAYCYRQ
jgi:hypothetical protein